MNYLRTTDAHDITTAASAIRTGWGGYGEGIYQFNWGGALWQIVQRESAVRVEDTATGHGITFTVEGNEWAWDCDTGSAAEAQLSYALIGQCERDEQAIVEFLGW